jgi:hypothetical protein
MNGITINNISSNDVNISILKNKYKLLDKIGEDKLEFVIDEIFELGYSQYMKNFIKTDLVNEFQSYQNNLIKPINTITESKFSTLKGSMGEDLVMDIIIDKFNNMCVENTSKIPHSGDIQVRLPSGNTIIVEVKNYNKTIDQDQIDKLKFDMMFNNIRGAIFISLNSGIVGKKKFDLEIFKYNCNDYYILFLPYSMHKIIPDKKNTILHTDMEDSVYNLSVKIEFGLCVIQNIIDKSMCVVGNKNTSISSIDMDFMVSQFNSVYSEFKIVKNSIRKLDENIRKSLDSHKNTITEFENSIVKKINDLIGTKMYSQEIYSSDKKNIIVKKNNSNSYDIFINNELNGRIVKILNLYDVLVNFNSNIINKQFNNLDDSKLFIKNL